MEIFQFGKYKGRKVDEICETDPEYCLWLNANVPSFELTQEQYSAAQYKLYQNKEYRGRLEDEYGSLEEMFGNFPDSW